MKTEISNARRKKIIKAAVAFVWVGLGILLFIFNRGHSILLDNHNVESPSLRAPDMIKVTVDKGKSLEFFRGDRDIVDVGGGQHYAKVEFSDGTPPFEASFSLPLGPDIFLLSIPKMINGIEPYIEVFRTQPRPIPQEEDKTEEESG
jgi:hypothetical protein